MVNDFEMDEDYNFIEKLFEIFKDFGVFRDYRVVIMDCRIENFKCVLVDSDV